MTSELGPTLHAGAKAQSLFCCLCGTAKAMPCYKTWLASSFPQPVKASFSCGLWGAAEVVACYKTWPVASKEPGPVVVSKEPGPFAVCNEL
jgi:hypothetical protein